VPTNAARWPRRRPPPLRPPPSPASAVAGGLGLFSLPLLRLRLPKRSPHAVIDPSAEIDDDAEIGPFCLIGPDCQDRAGCVCSQLTIIGTTTIGRDHASSHA